MSAIANIAIDDGASTPVTHTFGPMSTNPAVYRNGSSSGSANGLAYDETFSIAVRLDPKGLSKVDLALVLPHDLDGPGFSTDPLTRSYDQVKVSFVFPPSSTTQNRMDARVLIANALLNSQVVDAVDNLNPPY